MQFNIYTHIHTQVYNIQVYLIPAGKRTSSWIIYTPVYNITYTIWHGYNRARSYRRDGKCLIVSNRVKHRHQRFDKNDFLCDIIALYTVYCMPFTVYLARFLPIGLIRSLQLLLCQFALSAVLSTLGRDAFVQHSYTSSILTALMALSQFFSLLNQQRKYQRESTRNFKSINALKHELANPALIKCFAINTFQYYY